MAQGKASATARERARVSLTADIKEEARRQLAAVGADALSLRAVARELGMASSAVYRYFASKDDLLTALIIDAYNALGEVAETAVSDALSRPPRARWLAACHAIRAWALAHPHEYALIYGSPVPGYRAPEATIGPASRVPLALISVLGDARAGSAGAEGENITPVLAGQAAALTAALGEAVRPDVLVRAAVAWTQLFGMISFELFGQFVRTFEPADELFEYGVARMAQLVGLLSVSLLSVSMLTMGMAAATFSRAAGLRGAAGGKYETWQVTLCYQTITISIPAGRSSSIIPTQPTGGNRMGIQDIIGKLGGQGGQQAAIDQIHKLFGGNGIQGVVTQMTSAGLGQQVQSWVGMGNNIPVSGQQLQQAMDPAALQQLAQSTGMPPSQVADQVAQVLPHIVDQATPDGQLPDPTVAGKGASASATAKGASASASNLKDTFDR